MMRALGYTTAAPHDDLGKKYQDHYNERRLRSRHAAGGRLVLALETDVRIADMNWMQVEEYLQHDDRAVLPLGSTEQHSHLRLTVDCILPERVAADAAEPLGVPVFPVVPYGVTPYLREFPGSISLKVDTHLRVVGDILDSLAHSGFRRILIVNGHGGNSAVQQFVPEWTANHPGCRVLFHNWWNAPRTWAKVQAIDPVASHGSWVENFPWTRLPGVSVPDGSARWWTSRACAFSIRSRCGRISAGLLVWARRRSANMRTA